MNNKLSTALEGIIILVLGVLISIYGVTAVADTYFAIVFLVVGIASITLACFHIAKKLPLPVLYVLMGAVLISISIGLFTGWVSFGVFINLMVLVIMGVGAGLMLTGLYFLVKGYVFNGIGQLVAGAICVLLSALYLGIPDFRTAFWIIVGIVIALYGAFVLISAFVGSPKKSHK